MQGNGEAIALRPVDENMAEGDLGDGMERRLAALDLQTRGPPPPGPASRAAPQRGSRASDAGFSLTGFSLPLTSLKTRSGSMVDLSKEELRERLQEASETLEVLRCELEVTHRYLEGKYEALKILQGKAILDKATTHTKSQLQKSEERARALEKEVNALQWEITFNQVQMRKSEQAWEQQSNRMNSENKALNKVLEESEREIRELKTENSGLSQQCVELLSMLSVKEQKAYERTKPPRSPRRDGTVLEMAVLGACRCPGLMESCPCAKTAAASRTQLLQLKQELDLLVRSREEALLVADAFRIAFEQQLRKRSDHLLLQAEAPSPNSYASQSQGANRTLVGVAKKLKAMIPSGLETKASLEHTDTLRRLLDLLNDKEEALAHQRKVSHMLAHHAQELQKRLPAEATRPFDAQTKPLELLGTAPMTFGDSHVKKSPQLSLSDLMDKRQQLHHSPVGKQDPPHQEEVSLDRKNQILEVPATGNQTGEPSPSNTRTGEPSLSNTKTEEPPVSNTQTGELQVSKTQTEEPPVSNTQTGEPPVSNTQTEEPLDTNPPTEEPLDTYTVKEEPRVSRTPTGEPHVSNSQTGEPPVSNTQTGEPLDTNPQTEEPLDTYSVKEEPLVSSTPTGEPPLSNTQTGEPHVSISNTQTGEPPVSNTQTGEPVDTNTVTEDPPVSTTPT